MTETKTGFWKVNFELNLEGEEVRFDDLSDETREHIIKSISDGFTSGEIIEEQEYEYEPDNIERTSIVLK